MYPGKLIFIGLGIICRIFSEFQFFLKKLKIFKSLELFLLDFAGQTVWCSRCKKSLIFRKWRFRSFALLCSMRNQPFFGENWFWRKFMVFEKKIFVQNGAKIILNMIQGTKMVFYYRIQELVNPTKLNLIIAYSLCDMVETISCVKTFYLFLSFIFL